LKVGGGFRTSKGDWGEVKLSMTRFVAGLIGLLAIGWSGMAFADATTIITACPTNFACAFTAAETQAFGVPKSSGLLPGQPDVFVGYMEFDGTGAFSMAGSQNLNGTVTPFSKTGKCVVGKPGQPSVITLNDNSQLSFVLDSIPSLLQFIVTNDASTSTTANSVRVGVCHKL
jgi:hypothetical protein